MRPSDPPAPKARQHNEQPPASTSPDIAQRPWKFNPDYEKLVEAWETVMPQLDSLTSALDKAYSLAKSPQTWDAPVGERYVEDIREWRSRLDQYRNKVLTAISEEANDTPRWVRTTDVPYVFPTGP